MWRFAQPTVSRERYGECNGEIARRLGIRRGEQVDFRRGIKFSLMPLVLAGLMRCLSRAERLQVNARRSDLREDFLVSWLTQLRGRKLSFKTLARAFVYVTLSETPFVKELVAPHLRDFFDDSSREEREREREG